MRLLVIRMSSLGDLILSTAFLENLPADAQVDWIISKEFSFVLEGHPQIKNLYVFDKAQKLKGWIALLRKTLLTEYDARVDLHVTHRSKIARIFFFVQDLKRKRLIPWRAISKERFYFFALLLFKKYTPSFLIPTPFWRRFAVIAQSLAPRVFPLSGVPLKPPSYLPLLVAESSEREAAILTRYQLTPHQYLAVMPASCIKAAMRSTAVADKAGTSSQKSIAKS